MRSKATGVVRGHSRRLWSRLPGSSGVGRLWKFKPPGTYLTRSVDYTASTWHLRSRTSAVAQIRRPGGHSASEAMPAAVGSITEITLGAKIAVICGQDSIEASPESESAARNAVRLLFMPYVDWDTRPGHAVSPSGEFLVGVIRHAAVVSYKQMSRFSEVAPPSLLDKSPLARICRSADSRDSILALAALDAVPLITVDYDHGVADLFSSATAGILQRSRHAQIFGGPESTPHPWPALVGTRRLVSAAPRRLFARSRGHSSCWSERRLPGLRLEGYERLAMKGRRDEILSAVGSEIPPLAAPDSGSGADAAFTVVLHAWEALAARLAARPPPSSLTCAWLTTRPITIASRGPTSRSTARPRLCGMGTGGWACCARRTSATLPWSTRPRRGWGA